MDTSMVNLCDPLPDYSVIFVEMCTFGCEHIFVVL